MRQFYTLQTNFEAKNGNSWKEAIVIIIVQMRVMVLE